MSEKTRDIFIHYSLAKVGDTIQTVTYVKN